MLGYPQKTAKCTSSIILLELHPCHGLHHAIYSIPIQGLFAFPTKKKNCLVVSTHLKKNSQNGNLPQTGVKIKNIWNQHLVTISYNAPSCYHPRAFRVPEKKTKTKILGESSRNQQCHSTTGDHILCPHDCFFSFFPAVFFGAGKWPPRNRMGFGDVGLPFFLRTSHEISQWQQLNVMKVEGYEIQQMFWQSRPRSNCVTWKGTHGLLFR